MAVESPTSRNTGTTGKVHEDLVARLTLENAQLRRALESRIVIEQAKGAISVRSDVPVDVAFELLRALARNRRQNIRDVAAEVVSNGGRLDGRSPRVGTRR
jgi:AmiR/NasT family two-component response regulator